ncbi:uncharacterized protein LOC123267942 [Cotesia glomerata]|uniref:uncharacterized protein LOC123267942 n=1 Tax=Cotesia glomerata TaxID=32391 RepID=UPI001D034C1A|nr:uncharacterized protein LOC123267942 [Cotesia glomerata]
MQLSRAVIGAALNTNNLIHWQDLENAFQNRIKTGSIINEGHIDLQNFLYDAKKILINKIQTTLKTEEIEENKSFNTPTVDILPSTSFENWFKEDVYNTVLQKIEEFNEKDSGWSLSEVINLDVNISRFAPIHVGFSKFISLPKKIMDTGGIVNIQNKNMYCFSWCIKAALFPAKDHPYRVSSYKNLDDKFNLKDSLSAQVLLATALVQVRPHHGNPITARVLIDQGSELSFMRQSLFKKLGLPLQRDMVMLKGIGNVSAGISLGVSTIELRSLCTTTSLHVSMHILPTLTVDLPSFVIADPKWPHLENLKLADPQYLQPRPVDIILGASPAAQIMNAEIQRGPRNAPIAQSTTLGWIVYGAVTAKHASTSHAALHASEEVPSGNSSLNTAEEDECEIHFRQTHYRQPDGRYVVRLPLKALESQLGDCINAAMGSLRRLITRLSREREYSDMYRAFMAEYIQLGHMVRVPVNELPANAYFLPHHGVLKLDSATTKLRTVFNGSCATSTGISLNDILHAGPKTQIDIFDMMLRIRCSRILFATDITKMFRQIEVDSLDWPLQCILWIDENDLIDAYCLKTVTYGTASAPFDAVRVLIQLVKDEGHRFPLAVAPMLKTRYVDDIYGGADNEEDAIKAAVQSKALCAAGCFPLAKWASNSPRLLAEVAPEKQLDTPLKEISDAPVKVLGMYWNSRTDALQFKYTLPPETPKTKRAILSEIAKLYDPLGLLAPIVVKAKIFMQNLWLDRVSWDEQLSPSLIHKWTGYREDLRNIESIRIPRWNNIAPGATMELHGFSDASQNAMAAAVYLRVTDADGNKGLTFVFKNAKVQSLKNVRINLWTDSAVTLAWIKSPAIRWKTFVRNRVGKIQETLRDVSWKFIPGKQNPADCASRGIPTLKLKQHALCWQGPTWLHEPESSWPTLEPPTDNATHREERQGLTLVTWKAENCLLQQLLSHYTQLFPLLQKLSIWHRAIDRFKRVPQSSLAYPLTPSDLERAKLTLIKFTQGQYFAREIHTLQDGDGLPKNNSITKLTPFIDHQGVLRVGNRLKNALLDPEERHPAILPRQSPLTSILIDDSHRKTLHGGTQLTLADLRKSVWIIGGRVPVRSFILRCVICTRHRGERAQQLMGQLPAARVQPTRAFLHTGLDYAGPITLKTFQGRGAKTYKGWIAVFVCMFSSAVHLELVTDYTAADFIAAYRRFTSRRGICHTLYSDCGTNFVGADKELKRLFAAGSRTLRELSTLIAQDGTNWKFNPPGAPYFGGKWEAAVKPIKFHFRRTIRDSLLTLEPLTPLNEDPADLAVLTPGHFLIGQSLTAIPEPSLTDLQPARLLHWKQVQQMVQNFWKRYYQDYIHRYQAISKWHHRRNQIKVGSVVLITTEDLPPTKWPLAKVIAVHPGEDGQICVVTVKTVNTELVRPITKLCVLPLTHEEDDLVDAAANPGENVR